MLKTAPVVGSQSKFRDVMADRTDYFPEIPNSEGFPDNMFRETKAVIATNEILLSPHLQVNFSSEDFEDGIQCMSYEYIDDMRLPRLIDFGKYRDRVSEEMGYARYMTYSDLNNIWEDTVRESVLKEMQETAEAGENLSSIAIK